MNIIKEHIKSNDYKPVYLLYGSECYLKKLYRDKLKSGILGDGDSLNYSYFEGKSAVVSEIKNFTETLPFFSDRRLIIIENSNWFKTQSDFDVYLKEMPLTTYIVFVEAEVDKRSHLYKTVKDIGYVCEMNSMDERNLRLFAGSFFKKDGKLISESALNFFLNTVGTDMFNIINEAEKLISYALTREVVTVDDVLAVCTEQISNKIFLMIDAVAQKNQQKALDLYYDLIALREKPLSILFLIVRHFNILIQIKEISSTTGDTKLISNKVSVPPFAVGKYIAQSKNFQTSRLKELLTYGTEIEEQIKTGYLDEKIGVELLIIKCSDM